MADTEETVPNMTLPFPAPDWETLLQHAQVPEHADPTFLGPPPGLITELYAGSPNFTQSDRDGNSYSTTDEGSTLTCNGVTHVLTPADAAALMGPKFDSVVEDAAKLSFWQFDPSRTTGDEYDWKAPASETPHTKEDLGDLSPPARLCEKYDNIVKSRE